MFFIAACLKLAKEVVLPNTAAMANLENDTDLENELPVALLNIRDVLDD